MHQQLDSTAIQLKRSTKVSEHAEAARSVVKGRKENLLLITNFVND